MLLIEAYSHNLFKLVPALSGSIFDSKTTMNEPMPSNEAHMLERQVRLELKRFELSKLEAKLNNLRHDWSEREKELSAEMQQVLSEKSALEDCLVKILYEEQQIAEQALTQAKLSFDGEMVKLSNEKNGLQQKCLEQKQKLEEKESSLRDISLQLSSGEIDQSTLNSHVSKIKALKAALEQESKRRAECEEHFERVDRNKAEIKVEEEKFRRVAVKEEEAMQLLHQGARGVQKLWRGMVAREQFTKLKKKSKKKGKGKKGKSKKKF